MSAKRTHAPPTPIAAAPVVEEDRDRAWDVLQADFVAAASSETSFPAPALTEIAFAGRSNVGKSSMLNAVMQRKGLVRTSSTPGHTRSVNLFRATTRGGLEVQLVDLPGYGFAKRSKAERIKWGPMLEGYLRGRPTLRAVIVLVDARRGLEDDDYALLEFCAEERPGNADVATAIVATKLDLLPKAKRKPALEVIKKAAGRRVIGFSAETGDGRIDVWRAIDKWVRGDAT